MIVLYIGSRTWSQDFPTLNHFDGRKKVIKHRDPFLKSNLMHVLKKNLSEDNCTTSLKMVLDNL